MSAAGKNVACAEFSQHAWKPEVCVNCQQPRSSHQRGSATSATAGTPSARISVDQIDILISNTSESSPPPSLSSSLSHGQVSSRQAATLPRQIKIDKPRIAGNETTDVGQNHCDKAVNGESESLAEGSSSKRNVVVKRSEGGQLTELASGKSEIQHQAQPSRSSDWRRSKSLHQLSSNFSSTANDKTDSFDTDNNRQTSGRDKFKVGKDESDKKENEAASNENLPKGILSRKGNKGNKISEERPSSRVAFIDTHPDIIGYDGGFNSIFDEDDDVKNGDEDDPLSSSSDGNFSLTDEEKSFALLALENTLWNSDAENLLRDKDTARPQTIRSSREFEDIHSDIWGTTKHFCMLKDCDATQRFKFHTFPLRKRSSSGAKLSVESVFNENNIASPALNSRQESMKELENFSENCKTSKDLRNAQTRIRMDESPSSNAYKVVNIVDEIPTSPTANFLENDLSSFESSTSRSGVGQVSSESSDSPNRVKVRGRPRPQAIRVSTFESPQPSLRDGSVEHGDETDALNDSTTAAGLKVLALLNDVLDNYGDNESSTDDPKDEEDGGGKKAFEARMASVAATLDLSKQRMAKRPAPRPPSSPPPDPTTTQSPKRKPFNQPEPVFKMVTVGRAIMTLPQSQDVPSSPSSGQGFPSFDDLGEGDGEKVNGEGGKKKGITSFFKNILRRGKDSEGAFESSNPEVQFAVKSEAGSSSAPSLTEKGYEPSSMAGKYRVLPQSSARGGSSSTGDLPRKTSDGDSSGDGVVKGSNSPPTQHKNKGLGSPKQMLRRTAAKLSPPTQRKEEFLSASKSKPSPTAAKPDDKDDSSSTQPTPARRRAKSPKRIPPPAPPPARPKKEEESLTVDLTRELEQRLRSASVGSSGSNVTIASDGSDSAISSCAKPSAEMAATSKSATLGVKSESGISPTARTEIRKSMTVPPPSPPISKPSQVSPPPVSPTFEESDHSQPGSPSDDTTSNSDDSPRFSERIELPTAAPGKKGILGKLNMSRKSRAPAPPVSVKRTQSVGEGEKKAKKINPADISGPIVQHGTKTLERRNTVSAGEVSASSALTQSIDKGYDDMDMPILSPLGSLENLYEAILPKEGESGKFPYYDQTDSPSPARSLCPNVPAEGYLEPVAQALTVLVAAEAAALEESNTGGISRPVSPAKKASAVESKADEKQPVKNVTVEKKASASPAKKPIVAKLPSRSSTSSSTSSGQGKHFVEPELTEERIRLLASQPIYEEIPANGPEDLWEEGSSGDSSRDTQSSFHGSLAKGAEVSQRPPPIQSATLPHPKKKPLKESAPKIHRRGSASQSDNLQALLPGAGAQQEMTSSSALAQSTGCMLPSPFMTASMTSSFMWHTALSPAQPVDSNGELLPLPPIPAMAPRSVSKETVSSESDTQSSGSTLTRPRPIPRRRPKRPETTGSDQYVSMNRPNTHVTLCESKLRETFSRLTALNFQTLHDVYVQSERLLALEKMTLPPSQTVLKWADFDIYGQALHATGRCVVYNAKLRSSNTACQIMVLHSRPAAELSLSAHPSLLRPATVFADNVPFSFLTAEFIKTSQLLQNSVYDSNQARCFLAVGLFDIADSLAYHLALLRETLTHDLGGYLQVVMMTVLQLLSAFSHCQDRGFTVTETDLGDVFHIARQDLRGKVVAFLPHQRTPDVPQGEAMCGFLDKLLQESTNSFYTQTPTPKLSAGLAAKHVAAVDSAADDLARDDERRLKTTVERMRILLEPRRIECLSLLRAMVEYTLWGPRDFGDEGSGEDNSEEAGSAEQIHSAWLERERAALVARFACCLDGLGDGVALEDFYRLKFLLKSSATSLAETWRRVH